MPAQLKETTMDPKTRTLARVTLPRAEEVVQDLVEALMGQLYLVTIVVVTSLKSVRTALGRHWWKLIHYTTYAAAAVFFTHGILADPLLEGRPPDFIDAEKVYVELCALSVVAATVWRIRHRRATRRAARA